MINTKIIVFISFTINYCYSVNNLAEQLPESILNNYVMKNTHEDLKFDFLDKLGVPTISDISTLILNLINNLSIPTLISNNLSSDLIEDTLQKYVAGVSNEDVNLNIVQLITKYGYPVEQHNVQTNDGFILTFYRIPKNGPVAFLMHGLEGSSDDWVTAGPESGIAYLLAADGYDVWLGNARGNKHSRQHRSLSPSDAKFWDFSWDEIGRYDLPAMIDYVVNVSGETEVKYIGHSQGTTAFFVMCSMKPEYNSKVSLMVALSPVAWMSHIKSPIIRLISPINPLIHTILQAFGIHEFSPTSSVIKVIQNAMCGQKFLSEILCGNLLFLLCGFSQDQLNVTNLPVLYGHVPSGAATKQLVHYGQGIVSGHFRQFNYGSKENIVRYGSETPPDYPMHRIIAPVALFVADEDWLSNLTDVEILRKKLPNVIDYYFVPHSPFNHVDFIWGKNVKTLIYSKLRKLFEMF